MRERFKSRAEKAGLPPGALVYVGKERAERVRITIFDYDEQQFQETEAKSIQECFPFKEKPTVTWINIDGLHDVEVIASVAKQFDIHPLIVEDILNTGQRPKMEDFGAYIFVVLRMLSYDERDRKIDSEQVSLVLGSNFVISFQEAPGDVFDPVRERIRTAKGRIRQMKADHLAYSLIDAIVDNYFTILEKMGEQIDAMQEAVVSRPRPETLHTIHRLRGQMLALRRSAWPLREVISGLERGESPLIQKETRLYLRDVYDHTIQVIDAMETFRDTVSNVVDTFISSMSNRMNEIMKVLTIIATIFMPLTLIVGIYGMNFEFMPEIRWRWGYPAVWACMILVTAAMLAYFRKRKWV